MKKLLLLLLFPLTSLAQYSGPAVETCRAYALADAKAAGGNVTAVRFDNDRHLNMLKYTRKAGSQFVSSLLYGNGAILISKGPPVEMSFMCALASDKQAVLFFWSPRSEAPVYKQCTRDPAQKPNDCIDPLLQAAEFELTQLYARRFQEAHDADTKSGGTARVQAFRRANDAFLAYRSAECARRGPEGSDVNRACVVELSRRRGLDLD
jgi:uncharacterized protein YecT (DUF1311 family)